MPGIELKVGDAFDNRIIEILFAMDHKEDVRDIYIGVIHSRDEGHDSGVVARCIDNLIRELASADTNWSRLYLGGTTDDPFRPPQITFSEADKRNFELNGVTAGGFITRLVYDKLPIEWGTEGESAATLSFAIGDDYILTLSGKGTYDTAYLYDHENADLEHDEPSDSEVIYSMEFTADLFHCPAPSSE